ncbi:MAG TPA: NAD(P)H-hydrate epimerase, partial [Anaerolineales bacterium]|nr:NAD(P)H-hydrate epimerase [Anaerolineales bacterium]
MHARLVSVSEMVAIERAAAAAGHGYARMMEFAGRGLAEEVEEAYDFLRSEGALGLVGSGNNGGDTLVALDWLAQWGWTATACLVRPRPADDPLVTRLLASGGEVFSLEGDSSTTHLYERLASCGIVLDGVLGTGMRLPLKVEVAQALEHVRQALDGLEDPPVVVAVDCPSGVDCDSGEAAPETLPANLTVTMAAYKQGLLKFPAYDYVGELRLVGIGLPQDGDGLEPYRSLQITVPDMDDVRALLPLRPAQAHKGTFGTALIVAGSQNYTGAVLLAGEAAYRIGTGLVTLAVTEMIQPMLAGHIPEATWLVLPEAGGGVSPAAARVILDNLERVTGLLIGPGFGLASPTAEFIARFLAGGQYPVQLPVLPPLVVDAD